MEILTREALNEAWRTSNEPIGKYIINEDFNPDTLPAKMEITKDAKTGKPVGKAIFQSGGVRNRNGRIYAIEDLDREIHCTRTLELLKTKNLFCEAGHPIDTSLQRQSTIDWRNSNCKILTLETVGSNIEGLFTPSNTQLGKAFAEDLLEGVIPAFSLRALGSIRQTRLGAQVTDLRLITYDQVIYPSHSNAYMTELLGESAGLIPDKTEFYTKTISESGIVAIVDSTGNRLLPAEPLKESKQIEEFIKNNSNNLKYINDYFGAYFENITITPNDTKITLAEAGTNNKIVVPVEKYIHCELLNYVDKLTK